jgi:hypothetical protein
MSNLNKKIVNITLSLALVLALPIIAQAAVVGTLNISPSTVNQSATLTVSGNCGLGNGSSSVNFVVNANNTNTGIGAPVTTGTGGAFSTSFTVPASFATGAGTLIATCANGDTLTAPITINTLSSPNITVGSSNITAGNNFTVSGICGSSSGTTVNFTLVSGATSANLGTTTTTAGGNYSTSLSTPIGFPAGSSVVAASCSGGSVSTSDVTIVAASTGSTGTGSTGGTGGVGTDVGGTDETTPVGGVEAGSTAPSLILALILLVTGVLMVAFSRKQSYSHDA